MLRTASTPVRRYAGQRTAQPDAYRARTARHRHHQLRLSGLGLLNGRGLALFLGLARGLGFVGPGMGSCLGLGCRLRQASPTISLTSTVATCTDGVMQNHQAELISTGLDKSAGQIFHPAKGISSTSSCAHPFRCSPNSLRLSGDSDVTQRLEPIKLQRKHAMIFCSRRT